MHEIMKEYYHASRSPFYAFLFVVPLMMAYELSAFVMNRSDIEGLRNGADVVTKQILDLFGVAGFYGFSILVLIILITLFFQQLRDSGYDLQYRFLVMMLTESVIYGLAFGFIVDRITNVLLQTPHVFDFKSKIVLSLGAGVYEEFLFRVVLISASKLVLEKILEFKKSTSLVLSIIISSLVFSGFHHIGPLGEPFVLRDFVFRFVAGGILAVLYVLRGFGITAYTHSLYDLFIITRFIG